MASRAEDARVWVWAIGAAAAIHLGAVGGLSRIHPTWEPPPAPPVEFELRQPPPPPVETPEPPPPPAPPRVIEAPKVRIVPKTVAVKEPPREPTPPPPPNQQPTPETPTHAPPVFGVTLDSVVSGDSAGPAVPVGNTVMTKPTAARPTEKPQPYAAGAVQPFRPVPDVYIATSPKAIYKVEGEEVYPTDAKAVGLEGAVKLSVGLNEKGNVVDVKVLEKAGHGFDEAAVKALRQFRFRPALASDGHPVPCRIAYVYKFTMSE